VTRTLQASRARLSVTLRRLSPFLGGIQLGLERFNRSRTYLKIADCCRSDNNVE
jgi:hypothetical protein